MLLKDIICHDPNLSEVYSDTSVCESLNIATVGDGTQQDSLIFIRDKKYAANFFASSSTKEKSRVLIIAESIVNDYSDEFNKYAAIYSTANVNLAMSFLSKPLSFAQQENWEDYIDGRQLETTKIHPSVWIAQHAFIGANVVIREGTIIHSGARILSNTSIGKNTVIHPNVVIYPETIIGDNVIVHANSVIGSDGFGYNFDKGVHHKVYHLGNVVIENDVEIGSNCSVDRGTFGSTRIGSGTKIDNLVQIAHNNTIGSGVIICGQSGTAGSSKIGNYVVMGGRAAIADGVEVADQTQIGALAGVTRSWKEKGIKLAGFPARPLKEWLKSLALINKILKEDKK